MKMRIRSRARLVLAMVAAPLAATFVIPLVNCLRLLSSGGLGCSSGIAGYAWYGLIPAVLATVLIGLPLLFIVLRMGATLAWQFIFLGAIAGAIAAIVLGLLDTHLSTVGLLIVAVPSGACAALVVWFAGVYKNLAE